MRNASPTGLTHPRHGLHLTPRQTTKLTCNAGVSRCTKPRVLAWRAVAFFTGVAPKASGILLAISMVCAASGCLSDLFDDDGDAACAGSGAPVDVAGSWLVSGAGARGGCLDERFNGDFGFVPETPLNVIVADDGALALVEPIEGFSLSGSVDGRCVTLQTEEATDFGVVRFRVDGAFAVGRIEGRLSGSGPAGCTVAGDVTIDIQ